MIRFTVPGNPRGKARPGFTKTGHAYTPESTAAYESLVKLACHQAMLKQGAQMITGPVELTMTAYMPIPASYSEKRKRDLRLKPHTSRPDVDNVLKAVLDGVSGVAYADDKHVVAIHARKVYGEMPGLHVELKEIVEV